MARRITVIEHAKPALIDASPPGDSVGDMRIFSNDLYDEQNTGVVGADQGFCVRTLPGQRYECTWSNIFANGVIVTQGPGPDAAFTGAEATLAVTGGTGEFVGARGEVTVKKLAGADHQFTFVFDLID